MTDLISRKALLKSYGEWLHSDDEVPINDLITNAPAIEQGEEVAIYQVYLEADGWMDFSKEQYERFASWVHKRIVYTTPQQPQSVADALEEAAKICDDYALDIQEGIVNDPSKLADAIRALIKRNAKG